MEIVFHLGAPCTDGDRLIKSLLKNRGTLADKGVAVPSPSTYRTVIREASAALERGADPHALRDAVLESILGSDDADRLVMSNDKFICINRLVVQGAQIWPMIDKKAALLRGLFPRDTVEFHIGIRDPATLIPTLFKASRFSDFKEFSENMQPSALHWSETLARLQNAVPNTQITVWCNEDTPLIWGELLYELSGVGPLTPLVGGDDLLATIMDSNGQKRMSQWLQEHPPETEIQRRRVAAAFLDKYALADAIEEEVDAPGWSQALIDRISETYEEDIVRISRMQGVDFIAP